jgi:hypothetical protein
MNKNRCHCLSPCACVLAHRSVTAFGAYSRRRQVRTPMAFCDYCNQHIWYKSGTRLACSFISAGRDSFHGAVPS